MVSQGRLRIAELEDDQLGSELGQSPPGDCWNVLLGSSRSALLAHGQLGSRRQALSRSPKLSDPGIPQWAQSVGL